MIQPTTMAVIEALERAPAIVLPLVREVPPAILKRRPKPDKWSAHEHACHLAVVHRLFFDRLDLMLATPAAVIKPYCPTRPIPMTCCSSWTWSHRWRSTVEDRSRLVVRLRHLEPEDWSRTAEHGEYSHYSVFIMFRHLALHDFLHAYRIEEMLLKKDWDSAIVRVEP